MFEPVFESFKKATEATVQAQREVFKQWSGLWPGLPAVHGKATEQAQGVHKKWAEFCEEILNKQRQTLETQFKAGLEQIEQAFRLAEIKDPQEMRAKTMELWQRIFETLHQTFQGQMRDCYEAASRWTEMFTKGAA
jgi:hypothetical protein